MKWAFLGHACAVYLACAIVAAIDLPTYREPLLGAAVQMIFFPFIVIGLTAEAFFRLSDEQRDDVRVALQQRVMLPSAVFGAGALAGAATMSIFAALNLTSIFGTQSFGVAIIAGGLCLLMFPALACSWVVVEAKRRVAASAGFPVIQIPPDKHE